MSASAKVAAVIVAVSCLAGLLLMLVLVIHREGSPPLPTEKPPKERLIPREAGWGVSEIISPGAAPNAWVFTSPDGERFLLVYNHSSIRLGAPAEKKAQ